MNGNQSILEKILNRVISTQVSLVYREFFTTPIYFVLFALISQLAIMLFSKSTIPSVYANEIMLSMLDDLIQKLLICSIGTFILLKITNFKIENEEKEQLGLIIKLLFVLIAILIVITVILGSLLNAVGLHFVVEPLIKLCLLAVLVLIFVLPVKFLKKTYGSVYGALLKVISVYIFIVYLASVISVFLFDIFTVLVLVVTKLAYGV